MAAAALALFAGLPGARGVGIRAPSGLGARAHVARAAMPAMAAAGVSLEVTADYETIKRAAEFFALEFWGQADALSKEQQEQLAGQHRADFDKRYGALTGKRRFPSALLLAYGSGGEIVGCAGIEMTIIDRSYFWDRSQAEALFSDKFAAMGGRERNQYRKASLQDLATAFLEGQAVRPVLSNLAVRRASRGTGLGERLVQGCEELVRGNDAWVGDDLWLLVDSQNAPAIKLYTRLGFDELWRQETLATRLLPAGGALEVGQEPAVLLAMAKKL